MLEFPRGQKIEVLPEEQTVADFKCRVNGWTR